MAARVLSIDPGIANLGWAAADVTPTGIVITAIGTSALNHQPRHYSNILDWMRWYESKYPLPNVVLVEHQVDQLTAARSPMKMLPSACIMTGIEVGAARGWGAQVIEVEPVATKGFHGILVRGNGLTPGDRDRLKRERAVQAARQLCPAGFGKEVLSDHVADALLQLHYWAHVLAFPSCHCPCGGVELPDLEQHPGETKKRRGGGSRRVSGQSNEDHRA